MCLDRSSSFSFLSSNLDKASLILLPVLWSSWCLRTTSATSLSKPELAMGFPSFRSCSFERIIATGLGADSSIDQSPWTSASNVSEGRCFMASSNFFVIPSLRLNLFASSWIFALSPEASFSCCGGLSPMTPGASAGASPIKSYKSGPSCFTGAVGCGV